MFECVEMFEILSSEDVEEVGVQMNSLACSFFLLQMIHLSKIPECFRCRGLL